VGSSRTSAPVSEGGIEDVVCEPGALPEGEVGVLNGEGRQGGGLALGEGLIKGGDLADQHAGGPAVADDVVQGEKQDKDVGLTIKLEQTSAEERTAGEIEGSGGLVLDGVGQLLRGDAGARDGGGSGSGRDDLDRLAVIELEVSAEDFVAGEEMSEGEVEGVEVELAAEADGHGEIVGGRSGLELVEEPEALLGEGEGERGGARSGEQRRSGVEAAVTAGVLDSFGQTGDGGSFEEAAEFEFDAEDLAGLGDDLGGEQGVAAEFEEVVVNADAWKAENSSPDAAEQLFDGGAGRLVGWAGEGGGGLGIGQGVAVEFAVGSEGQLGQDAPGGGNHVVGEAGLEVGAEFGGVEGIAAEIGDQTSVAQHHRGLGHAGVLAEGGFDLAGFDAEAAEFDLLVTAAEELEDAVAAPAGQVAGAVEARARGTERIGKEAFGGEGGIAQIAASQTGAADVEFAGQADAGYRPVLLQYIQSRIGNRRADDGVDHLVRKRVLGRDDGSFRRSIQHSDLR
jgi:hypothetical protein